MHAFRRISTLFPQNLLTPGSRVDCPYLNPIPLRSLVCQRIEPISADTKNLCDIPQFWPPAQSLRLPLVEYTAREVRSGLLFWAFAQKRSAAASAVFAASAISLSKHRPINTISISPARTHTRNFKLLGKSSSGSLLARHSNSACFHRCSWIVTSMTQGNTMYLAIPM